MQNPMGNSIIIDGVKINFTRIRVKSSPSRSKPFYYVECEGEISGRKNRGLWKVLDSLKPVHILEVGNKKHTVEMIPITHSYTKDEKNVTWFCFVLYPVSKLKAKAT